ncbi:MAG: oligoendopeptidase F [Tissierellia bacterium]|nr:oligoendopeptidase F [Tissierellia bacterium]
MEEYKWDLSKIYSDDDHFYSDMDKVEQYIKKIENLKEDFKSNFKEIVTTMAESSEIMSRLYVYSHMKRDEDSRQSEGQKMALETESLNAKLEIILSFFNPSILSLDADELDILIKDNDLENYRAYLYKIFRYKKYTLSKEEEYIMGSLLELADAPVNSYYLLMNADMTFPFLEKAGERLTNANYVDMLRKNDSEIRKEAFEKMYSTLKNVKNSVSSMMYSNLKSLAIESKLRGFKSSREMKLFDDNIPVDVYDNLLQIIESYLPVLHRYYEIRKEHLGLEKQNIYDIYLPLSIDYDKKFSYEDAQEILIKALAPMGEDYIRDLKRAFTDNWVDVYPREGKRGGAYSWGEYKSDPYILMNYTGQLDSLFTLAHELGHSMHSFYSRKNNDYIYSSYSIFVAEVASTTNELLLLDYLIENAEDDIEKLHLVNHYVDSFKSTVFRQSMFAEFERETSALVDADNALTLEDFNDLYYKLNQKYFGDAVFLDRDIELEWTRIPHFYMGFYVYKYATGFSTAVTLSRNILDKKPGALKKYLEFLKDGGNNYPLDQLREAGADISKRETLNYAMQVFEEKVNLLEKLLKS